MTPKPETTIKELMEKFPNGFSIGPGKPDNPGRASKIIFASSHFHAIVSRYNHLTGNQGYLVVDMDV